MNELEKYFANPINTDELIKWEEVAKEKPDAELVSIPIIKLMPLLRKLSEFGIW